MELVVLDIESFWSQTHSLSKMSPIAYVMHPETELISCSIKVGDAPTDVFFGEADIRRHLKALDWSNKLALAHNMSEFDALVLAWRLGIKPAMWGCTLAMARPIHAKDVGLSLKKLVEHYGIGVKNDLVLHSTRGKHLADFTPDELRAMEKYNREDTDQCYALFHKLKVHYSPAELWHLDCNIRMLVEPKFVVDTGLLQTALSVERSNKHAALIEVASMLRPRLEAEPCYDGADTPDYAVHDAEDFWNNEEVVAEWVREQMASSAKFADFLVSRGEEVPLKVSPTNPDKLVPALAKTDEVFVAMQDHEDPVIAAAVRARLAVKSTLLETRIEAFCETAGTLGGLLPVPIKYAGADTTGRDSGWLYNPQNLPRITDGKPKVSDALRNCLHAPKGHVIGVADQSGIELRVNHFLWKVPETMAAYADDVKADLYRDLAAWYYQVEPDAVEKPQRQMGKVMHLGLGFGSGGKTFMRIARLMGGIRLDLPAAQNAVTGWRTRYEPIVTGWATCGESLNYIAQGVKRTVDPWGLVTTSKDGLHLPSGRLIRYPGLRFVDEGQTWPDGRSKKSWVYGQGRHKAYLSGPKVDENIVQALARDSVFECALRFFKLSGFRPIMRVHDELIYAFPQSEAASLLATLQGEMRKPPSWWPELIVHSEGDIAPTYGAAK